MHGTIDTYDANDGLGWIHLDDGRRVRFGLTACGTLIPTPGLAVKVSGLVDQRGALRATEVRSRSVFASRARGPKRFGLARFDSTDPRGDLGVPAGYLVRWLVLHDLMSEAFVAQHAALIDEVKRGAKTGRELLTHACDEKPLSTDLGDEGLRFWLHYYGRPLLRLFRPKLWTDLMRVAGVPEAGIFQLDERAATTPLILDAISDAFARWRSA